ncbi:MAG: methylated-DNA--[protein]-cysteine S-methyltransferase [Azoarcus sp.]|jgi:methylated-DNA-[protein]-cysteine S-methyltransferase|nr:methylated-DNA--[protein]-cysteine S-methyltransferase [Azoarcus sp.]
MSDEKTRWEAENPTQAKRHKYCAIYNTAFGEMLISSDGESITGVRLASISSIKTVDSPCRLTDIAATQLEEYSTGQRKTFDLPLNPIGTKFQRYAWANLCDIPYGETRSYKQVAAATGNPAASRAIGMANNKNPIMIIIPCHRVIGSNGKLVGYAGGLPLKKRLLELEQHHKQALPGLLPG